MVFLEGQGSACVGRHKNSNQYMVNQKYREGAGGHGFAEGGQPAPLDELGEPGQE